ncbi:hypothetical protein LTR62_002536 [Meristemomyces frigidus]|uniref:Uncharacterized protein n=1 Tax=Meristemomyces frigidus TaxID=1508187 RepID=A0AAN7YHI4_9PEZI|nr:hypothetical protein LTR62_002536 [Meristemomyces frigidus]
MPGTAKKRAMDERKRIQEASRASTSVTASCLEKSESDSKSESNSKSEQADTTVPADDDSSRNSVSNYDGNRDETSGDTRNPTTSRVVVDPKNFDISAAGWASIRNVTTQMPARPKPSTLGQGIKVGLNTFRIKKVPEKKVFQFDVLIGSGAEKRGLMKRVWESKAIAKALGKGWIYDGNKLAWSMNPIDREHKILVDLDSPEEGGRPAVGGKENKHRVLIRQTNYVGFDVLMGYLDGKCGFDNTILEAINFFDHLLGEYPRMRYTQIKRNFFAKGETRFDLGNAVEAFKGVYQSLRIAHKGGNVACLSINVDVANGTFWKQLTLPIAAVQLCGSRDANDLSYSLRQGVKDGVKVGPQSRHFQALKKMSKLHVEAKHRNQKETDKYVIERFLTQNSREYKFEKDGKMVSVYDYFARTYNIRLQYPDLPVVKMTKGKSTVLPMEVLTIEGNQRYAFKMDDRQTANMIKFAVEPPPQRWGAIQHGLKMLDWSSDPILKAFGVEVDSNKTVVDGRLLAAPLVKFGTGEAKPGTSGRWDLKGKKFLTPNTAPLKSWGVCVVPGRRGGKPDRSVVQNFMSEFVKIYKGHGGRVEMNEPTLVLANGDDVGAWVTDTWNKTGNATQCRPQILLFILPDKDTSVYGRIKRSAECRYGVVSQCMQYSHVMKAQAQYISNVCMKFNAKLGGSTCRAVGAKNNKDTGLLTEPTVIFGADVSHSAPGVDAPSMAALTCSMDRLGIRYAGACETNGYRVEMITTKNINNLMKPLLQSWVQGPGQGRFPKRIIYFRDGVSEGQYQYVLTQEVADMKALLKTAGLAQDIPFIVVVGGKRHHVRFFPEKGDRNGNPLPGTLVETGVTHPYENDFYLCSHAAIKGTARPMHYHVLLNEVGMSNEELQTMIYEHSYQYIRATTPVSMHPAIYYAHIVSGRAICHDPKWAMSSDNAPSVAPKPTTPVVPKPSGSQSGSQVKAASHSRSGSQGQAGSQGKAGSQGQLVVQGQTGPQGQIVAKGQTGGSSAVLRVDAEVLMPMPNQGGIGNVMWFI